MFWVIFGFFSIIPLVVLISNWRKIVNPIIEVTHEITINDRKKEYFPPQIAIESFGVQRNLTMVEATILLEKPFNEILSLILKNLIEKHALEIVSIIPLKIDVETLFQKNVLNYERDFARACRDRNPQQRRDDLQRVTIDLIKSVHIKMKGFSRQETIEHYEDILGTSFINAVENSPLTVATLLIEPLDEFTNTVTKETNPYADAPVFEEIPEYMKVKVPYRTRAERGILRGGGGGGTCAGGGCACACAGCACACAGGGR